MFESLKRERYIPSPIQTGERSHRNIIINNTIIYIFIFEFFSLLDFLSLQHDSGSLLNTETSTNLGSNNIIEMEDDIRIHRRLCFGT